jgi:hypothetical protein
MNKENAGKLAEQIRQLVENSGFVDVTSGNRITVEVSIRTRPAVRPSVDAILMDDSSTQFVKSNDEPFTEEHFKKILELPLSPMDRNFVQFFQKNGNKSYTAYQLINFGFSEKGNFASINKICRDHKLRLGVRAENSDTWDKTYHRFFVLKPKGKGKKIAYARG